MQVIISCLITGKKGYRAVKIKMSPTAMKMEGLIYNSVGLIDLGIHY